MQEVYKAVGRDDLASSYESREDTRTGLQLGGVVVGLVAIIPFTQWEDCDIQDHAAFDSCMSRNDDRIIWSTVLMGAGAGLFLIGRAIDAVGTEGPVELGKLEALVEGLGEGLGAGVRWRRSLAGALVTVHRDKVSVETAPARRVGHGSARRNALTKGGPKRASTAKSR